MKRTCKQCGKEFEISQSEISFYKSRKLQLPRRCKDCREANKQKKSDAGGSDIKEKKVMEATPAVPEKTPEAPVVVSRPEQGSKKTGIGRKIIYFAAAALIVIISQVIGNVNHPGDSQTMTAESAGSYTASELTFRSEQYLNDHYQKHGVEMGFSSAIAYQEAAAAVVNNENALHKTEAEDGDDVYYLENTNEFVIVSTDGYIRTYFNPDDGIDYYNRQ